MMGKLFLEGVFVWDLELHIEASSWIQLSWICCKSLGNQAQEVWFCYPSLSVWRQARAWAQGSACATTAGDCGVIPPLLGTTTGCGVCPSLLGTATGCGVIPPLLGTTTGCGVIAALLALGLNLVCYMCGSFPVRLVLKSVSTLQQWSDGDRSERWRIRPPLMDNSLGQGTKRDSINIYSVVKPK